MIDRDISGIQGTYASSVVSFDPNNRANKLKSDFTITTGGDTPGCDGEIDKLRVMGNDHHFHSTRPTTSKEYTTGQLEYAKTCVKTAIEVEGYTIDNEFEEEHNITVEEISFTDENNFDAVEHSDVVFGEDQKLCGQGLRFRINLENSGMGVFEALWNIGGANQFEYFYNLDAMDLICQHEIPTLSQLADHECIARHLSQSLFTPRSSVDSYWYKIDEDIEFEGVTYAAGTYIQVFADGSFKGNFVFADQEDVPIKECEEAYEVKDVVKLDINGIWVKSLPAKGDVSSGSDSCQIKHLGGDFYTITGISYDPPLTESYDYGKPIEDPVFQASKNPMPASYFPKDDLQFVPVWDEVGFIEGVVPLVDSDGAVGSPALVCPSDARANKDLVANPKDAILKKSENPNIKQNAQKVWDIRLWSAPPCGSIRDVFIGRPSEDPDICGFFTAEVLNPFSGRPTPNGRGPVPEYWKTATLLITQGGSLRYNAVVEVPENPTDTTDVDGQEFALMPAVIDCFLGNNKKEAYKPEDLVTCLHCDCHTITGSDVRFDIGCDPCEKCGDGDPERKMEEGPDYFHIQSVCPISDMTIGDITIEEIDDGKKIFITDDCVSSKCNDAFINHNINFVLEAGAEYSVEFYYNYRDSFDAPWDFAYSETDSNTVKYAEKETFRCIVKHRVCDGAWDFMKETPEFSGGSKLTATYRKIVDADEFNKCGSDRLPNLDYTDLDLLKVEGSVVDVTGDLDFFPQSAVAEAVDLTPIQGGLDAYDLDEADKIKIEELLGKLEKLDLKSNSENILGAVMHKTVVESQNEFCGMGAEFREERRKKDQDFKVHCNCENNNYVPSLYADQERGNPGYGTICQDEYDKIHEDWADALEDANLSVEDGNRIRMTHLYGPGTICGERIRKAFRNALTNDPTTGRELGDTWGFFGTRFVNCANGAQEDECCFKKHENKPVPKAHPNPGKRVCKDDLLEGYAAKLIGYTAEDAENYQGGVETPPNVRLEDLIAPIFPSELVTGLDQNHPPYKIEVLKRLYSLKEYSFEIGDN